MKKNLWFKSKVYGWGWYPVTWQGWICIVAFLGVVLLDMYLFRDSIKNSNGITFFMGRLIVYTAVLIVVSYVKGESPRWRWGR